MHGEKLYSEQFSTIALKMIHSIPLKKKCISHENVIFHEQIRIPGGNFASGEVWHTIVFKVSAFSLF